MPAPAAWRAPQVRSPRVEFARFGDHRDTAGSVLDGGSDQQAMLLEIHRRRFSGRADDNDTVAALANVEIDQTAQTFEVEVAVLEHRSDDGDDASLEHGVPLRLKARF
jgi:hypothetical protein